ncbi:MAG: nickel pincer cofactor biosynthesis protein LarC [Thermogutta sp.]
MRIVYFDCFSGISGDMVLGALVDTGINLEDLRHVVSSLGLPGCDLNAEVVTKGGFRATQVVVKTPQEQHHRHLHHILEMVERADLTARQKKWVEKVFVRLAEVEARVHGVPIEKVHFHEVGAADSIIDVVGSVVGLDLLGVQAVYSSPVPTGGGTVRIAHGEVGVPAPATAELLRGVPLLACEVMMEMTTPTGAAILTTFARQFGSLPPMRIEKIGYGAGSRDIPGRANVLRLFVGESQETAASPGLGIDQVWMVQTNWDDAPGELIGYVIEQLWKLGVLDVFVTPIQMKKNRPAVQLTVLCLVELIPQVEQILFRETTTLGVRFWPVERHTLLRRAEIVETPYGPVQGKVSFLPDGEARFSPEFEACRKLAGEKNLPLRVIYEAAELAFRQKNACQEKGPGTASADPLEEK